MNQTTVGSQNGFTFDTCVGIKICANSNLGSSLACRVNFQNAPIHLSSQTIFETQKNGYNFEHVSKQIQNRVGAKVITGMITTDMINYAYYLEKVYPKLLHRGDSQILAYAIATGTTLVTCDKKLAEAARLSGVQVINPDLLHLDTFENNVKSQLKIIIKKVTVKQTIVKQQIKSQLLKPGQKIVWRAFK